MTNFKRARLFAAEKNIPYYVIDNCVRRSHRRQIPIKKIKGKLYIDVENKMLQDYIEKYKAREKTESAPKNPYENEKGEIIDFANWVKYDTHSGYMLEHNKWTTK